MLCLPFTKAADYIWHGGFSEKLDKQVYNDTDSAAGGPGLRHSGQMRQLIYTLVCGDDPNCAYTPGRFFKALHNYGCNCYPDNFAAQNPMDDTPELFNHMGANGKPIDSIDRACLEVHDAYKCMIQDYEMGLLNQEAGDGCYHGVNFAYHTDTNGDIICGPSSNPNYANNDKNGCRLAACEIERAFAYKVKDDLADPINFYKDNKKTMYDIYTDDSQCSKNTGGVQRDMCCGEYPDRSPYSQVTHDCCGDPGIIQPFGMCA